MQSARNTAAVTAALRGGHDDDEDEEDEEDEDEDADALECAVCAREPEWIEPADIGLPLAAAGCARWWWWWWWWWW